MRTRLLLPLLPVAAVLAVAAPADAANFTVSTTADKPVDGCATNGCTLREAVIEANASPDARSVITLPARDGYGLGITGANEDLAAKGDLDIRKHLTIQGAGLLATNVWQDSEDRVFDVAPGGTTASLTLRDVFVSGGRVESADGGTALVRAGGALTLERAGIGSGRAVNAGSQGGGIASSGPVTLRDSVLYENSADDDGGGIAMLAPAPLTVERSSAIGNVAGKRGGAIATVPGVTTTIAATTIASNSAEGPGGGGALLLGGGTVTDGTITANVADGAAGIVAGAPVALRNTIVAANTGFDEAPRNCDGPITSLGHNFEDVATCPLSAAGDLSGGGDPRLALPSSPVEKKLRRTVEADVERLLTRHPLAGSPVVDAGGDCASADQRGVTRPQHGMCDIGAIEAVFSGGRPAPVVVPVPVVATPPAAAPRGIAAVRVRPALSRLGVTTKKGRTAVRVTLDRPAQLQVKITTKPRRGKARTVATLRAAGKRGVTTITRRLRRGRYQVAVTATADGTTSPVVRKTFTVR